MTSNQLDQLVVVLVRARNPSNIGAVARAMHDFGFSRLRVVNEFAMPFEAAKSAVDAAHVMTAAERYSSVAEAVGDCSLVVGTTAVGERDLQHELLMLAQGAQRIRAELGRKPTDDDDRVGRVISDGRGGSGASGSSPVRRVALLFGSEKTGLSNEELSHCNWLLTVPMHKHPGLRHPSMNLGQAVAVCLYELVREPPQDDTAAMHAAAALTTQPEPATAAQLERITELLTEVMEKTGYRRRHAHNCSPDQVRRLVRRIGANAVDAPVWIGILKQVLWKLGEGSTASDSPGESRET
jgi:tRNA C32,U32 (ribose-2'-O)-methylase TrmJ